MTLIISYYYSQLEQLRVESNQVKRRWKCREWKFHSRPSHLQEDMELCSPWKTKLWQNSNDPYPVVVLNMCLYPLEYAIPPHLPSRYLSWKWGSSDSVHCRFIVLWQVLVQWHCFCYSFACIRSAGCSNIGGDWIWWWGTKLPNYYHHQFSLLPIWYCKGWELKFGHRKFTVDIATAPFGFVYTCI